MARYRITCIGRSERHQGHQHATTVGVGKDASSDGTRWTMQAVRDALDGGHRFYTVDSSGTQADLVPFDCSCGAKTISSSWASDTGPTCPPLPACSWAA